MNRILISENANDIIKKYLATKCPIIQIKKTDVVYDAISSHVDIYICKIKNNIIIAKEQLELIQYDLEQSQIKCRKGTSLLGHKYPKNIRYNAVYMGEYLIHNTKHTDAAVLDEAQKNGLEIIPVKQGYTKCNLVVINDYSVITSDEGLKHTLEQKNIDVLLIQKGFVKLEGFEYGFLGGASGKIGNTIVFNGNLEEHPDYMRIKQFIESKGLKLKYFIQYPLEDIGSIIEVGDKQ